MSFQQGQGVVANVIHDTSGDPPGSPRRQRPPQDNPANALSTRVPQDAIDSVRQASVASFLRRDRSEG